MLGLRLLLKDYAAVTIWGKIVRGGEWGGPKGEVEGGILIPIKPHHGK